MLTTNIFIEQLRKRDSSEVALLKGDEQITIGELWRNSLLLAQGLEREGMKAGDKVILACEPGADFLAIVFATMLLRAQVAIIDPEMGRDNYRAKLKQFQPNWAFIDYRLLLLQEHPIIRQVYFYTQKKGIYVPKTKGVKTVATGKWLPIVQKHFSLKQLLKQKKEEKQPSLSTNALAFKNHEYIITYTSGTVNTPKGVVHTFATLGNSIALIVDLLGKVESQKIATHLPHFMLIGVCAGIPIHIWNYESSPSEKLDFIEKEGITTLFGPPSDYLELIEACKENNRKLPNCLQHILLGSAPVHVPFLEKLINYTPNHTRITCMYGMTENLLVSTVDGRQKVETAVLGDLLGMPAKNVTIKIGEGEEILLQSPQLFARYLHLNERTEWHPTGDLGYLNEKGQIVLTGRKKDMVIRKNFNLYPALYEPTIKRIKGVKEAVIIGVYDEAAADERVILVIEEEQKLSEKTIRSQLTSGKYSIDKEALPDEIHFMPIPRSGRQQKINRKELRERF